MSIASGFLATGLFIDGFAGGGGASTGIGQAIGRDVDIALNHSPSAIAIHKANHPGTTHYCQDIRAAWPLAVTRMQPVAGMWMSPDCKEYSKAKGAPVKDRSIRSLADEVLPWLRDVRPTVAYLENVEEFEYAAPLDEQNRPIKGQEGRAFKRLVRQWRSVGYKVTWWVLKACDYGAPTSRKRLYVVMRCDGLPIVKPAATHGAPDSPGVRSGKLQPYLTAASCIDWSIPCPSIFDRDRELADATKRRIARGVVRYVMQRKPYLVNATTAPHITKFHTGSTGSPIDKEMPTVTGNGNPTRPAGAMPLGLVEAHLEKFNADSRPKSLSDPLCTVMASSAKHALVKTTLAPFVTYGQHGGASRSIEDPHHTIAASSKDQNCIAAATLVQTGWGEREGQAPRCLDAEKPLGTIMADGNKHAAVAAFLSKFASGNDATSPETPTQTIESKSKQAVVAAHMAQFNSNPDGSVNAGHDMRDLVSTIATRGPHQGVIETTLVEEGDLPPEMLDRAVLTAAFLVKYYGEGGQSQAADRPLDVVTTKARYAVVTVTIDAVTYVIVDIGLRMLKPRELARAQGFPEGYVLDPIVRKLLRGKWVDARLTIAEQISAIGNSVCPPVAQALVAANQPGIVPMRLAA
jgi:DNA (cytosine-5)-methyltransferase 1